MQERFANNCHLDVPRQYYCGELLRKDSLTLDRAGLNGREGVDRSSKRVSLQLVYEAPKFTITSSAGAFWTDTTYGYDSTYQGAVALSTAPTGVPTLVPNAPGYVRAATDPVRTGSVNRLEVSDRTEWSTELRIDSQLNDMLRLAGGAFYYKSKRSFEEQRFLATASTVYSGTSLVDNWAVFASASLDFNEYWSATVEGRYAEDTIGNDKSRIPVRPAPLFERTFTSVSPRYTVRYRATPQSTLYVNVAKGNKPGVINPDPRLRPTDPTFADEEKAWTYEIGSKNTLDSGRISLNAAAFYIDWTNQQMTTNVTFTDGAAGSIMINAGQSKVAGIELETQAAITNAFTAGLTYSWIKAQFVRFNDTEAQQLFGDPSLRGKRLPLVPEQQVNVFGRYAFPVGERLEGYVRADASYTDKKFAQVYNLAHTGYQKLVNLSVGVEGEHWTASAWVHNLTDDRTPSFGARYLDQLNLNVPQYVNADTAQNNVAGSTTTERGFVVGMPAKRQVGVNVSYRF